MKVHIQEVHRVVIARLEDVGRVQLDVTLVAPGEAFVSGRFKRFTESLDDGLG